MCAVDYRKTAARKEGTQRTPLELVPYPDPLYIYIIPIIPGHLNAERSLPKDKLNHFQDYQENDYNYNYSLLCLYSPVLMS